MTKKVLCSNPMLSLETENIAKLGTLTADNLSCMWNVFTKCAENLENGRRLENLSWRLWYREAVMTDHGANSNECMEYSLPDLSSSCDSIASSADSDAGASIYSPNSKSDTIRLNSTTNSGSQESSVRANPKDSSNSTSCIRPHTRRPSSRLLSSDTFNQLISSFSPLEKPLEKSFEKRSEKDSSSAYQTSDYHQEPPNESSNRQKRPTLTITVSEPYSTSSMPERQNDACSGKMIPSASILQNEYTTKESISKPVPSSRVKSKAKSISDSVVAAARAKEAEREKIAKVTVTPSKSTSVIHGFNPSISKTTPSSSNKTKPALQDHNAGFLKQIPDVKKHHPFFYLRGAYSDKNHSQSSSMVSTTDDEAISTRYSGASKYKTRCTDESGNITAKSDDEDAWVSEDEEANTPPFFFKRSPTPHHTSSYRNSALSLLLSKEDRPQSGHNDEPKVGLPSPSPVLNFNADNIDVHEAKFDMSHSSYLSDTASQSSEPRVYEISHKNANRAKLLNSEISESLRRDLLWERRQKASLSSAVLRRHYKANQSEDEDARNKEVVEKAFSNDCSVW
ncbi:DUF1752 family protein [Schizosaccharomyces cryophilus OY26]|uniref:DUF1752 family protein n=1 Tax=Schizosaccharomyces cryophilus (strain OY26 / ATCC MYA-4695 / CBS 11777 / NBRC 106824 / NRRL Y48691) TaxID=653667 RepID=S9VYK1_SCHCR|nr:DUF1752 family protein [Schizosaccharomyces cryophilus OY26]EPY50880.1 DUF1752 family protein [Schizosaccharomyces cryophilus OY26]